MNARVFRAITDPPGIIKAVEALRVTTNELITLSAGAFIDASGDGVVGFLAGAEYREGREGRDEFGEKLAPEKPDNFVLPAALLFQTEDVGEPVPFSPPEWARDFPKDEDLPFDQQVLLTPYSHAFWWLEWGGTMDNNLKVEEIRDELLKILMGLWDHMKNHGDHGMENRAITWIQPIIAKRESRRLMGDHILTENDIRSDRTFPDRVAYGGWPLDIHPPEGIYYRGKPYYISEQVNPYSIPFRCLYSKNIDNLMFAGRDISVTHVALGSTRVISTCAVEGEASGVAAYLCKKHGVFPRDIYRRHIPELQQQILKQGAYIVNIKNEDRDDLARAATVSASSSKVLNGVECFDGAYPLDTARAEMFYLSEDKLGQVELLLESARKDTVEITMHLCKAKSLFDFSSDNEIGLANAEVVAGKRAWYTFLFHKPIVPGPYRVWLPVTEGISWCFSYQEELATNSAFFDAAGQIWNARRKDLCFRIFPGSRAYEPANVVSGVTRPEFGANAWRSNPDLSLPQELLLTFSREQEMNAVYITFDTNLTESSDRMPKKWFPPEYREICTYKPVSENCVKNYAVFYLAKDGWKKVVNVVGNYQRRRVHRFETVKTDRLKIEVYATNGAPFVTLYEVRVYKEG